MVNGQWLVVNGEWSIGDSSVVFVRLSGVEALKLRAIAHAGDPPLLEELEEAGGRRLGVIIIWSIITS